MFHVCLDFDYPSAACRQRFHYLDKIGILHSYFKFSVARSKFDNVPWDSSGLFKASSNAEIKIFTKLPAGVGIETDTMISFLTSSHILMGSILILSIIYLSAILKS